MTKFHHRHFPDCSALLSGPTPPNDLAFRSDRLQINYFKTKEAWTDPLPHAHLESDECFLVFQGTIIVEVEGERVVIGPREFCGFPRGTYHQVVEVHPLIECLILRNSSGPDKKYLLPDGTSTTDSSYHQDIFRLLNGSRESTAEEPGSVK
jgi:mannose-6-phosphate isomerase-like protein (cupin superfamily)